MRSWLALCATLGAASALTGALGNPCALRWVAGTWPQAPWTLWSASLVHLSAGHLGANLLALAGLALLGHALRIGRTATMALAVAWPLGTALLMLWPQVTHYSGLSGLNHAAALVISMFCILHPGPVRWAPPIGLALLAGTGLKLWLEQAVTHPVMFDPGLGFGVVLAAHLSSALAGAVCGGIAALWTRRHGR